MRKIPSFHLISWCGNSVERHSFSTKNQVKLRYFLQCPYTIRLKLFSEYHSEFLIDLISLEFGQGLQSLLSETCLIESILKKATCIWACTINFKQPQYSRALSPSFKYTYIFWERSFKAPVKKDLIRTIWFKNNKRLKLMFRSSQQRCSVRKGALRNFAKFIGKHLQESLF